MLEITWHDAESKGFRDLIPTEWVLRDGITEECEHEVRGPRMGSYKAKCRRLVDALLVELDYRPYERFNMHQGMFVGVLRLQFSSSAREDITQVWWQEKDELEFKPCSTFVKFLRFDQDRTNRSFNFEEDIAESIKLTRKDRQRELAKYSIKPVRHEVIASVFRRNPHVVAEVLLKANGHCEGCKMPAPFRRAYNHEPFLEVHHVVRLADDGDDTVENAIALCPNCHRRAHYG